MMMWTLCRGDEPQQLRQFKDALGLDNTAAAEVHMNQARRFLRERAEAGSRSQDTEQRKALGKLVYVSYLVFGAQQAAFLMPLRRVFNIQPASVDVMRRDNAKQLFDNYIKAHGGELQVSHAGTSCLLKKHHLHPMAMTYPIGWESGVASASAFVGIKLLTPATLYPKLCAQSTADLLVSAMQLKGSHPTHPPPPLLHPSF